MGERSVEQIVERCQQGDEQAFGQLYNLMHDRLHRVCRHYTADEQTADDLLHDSFVLIFSKIGTLKDPQKAEAWMTTVTRNLAQTWLQRQQQDATVSLDALQQPIEVAAPMPMATLSSLRPRPPVATASRDGTMACAITPETSSWEAIGRFMRSMTRSAETHWDTTTASLSPRGVSAVRPLTIGE